MQSARMMLMFNILITMAYCFPTETEYNADISENNTTILDSMRNRNPLVVSGEAPKSEVVLVQFVYNGNGTDSDNESRGAEKDKYIIDGPQHKHMHMHLRKEESEKRTQDSATEKKKQEQSNELKPTASSTRKISQMMALTSLVPEEISPISGKWPKYFYDIFNPIHPFPELQSEKSNQIHTKQLQHENSGTFLSSYARERKEPLDTAGPQLNPISIYDREFNVPIFD